VPGQPIANNPFLLLAAALAISALVVGGPYASRAPGIDGSQPRQAYEAELTSKRTGSATGLRQSIDYLASEEDGKPYAVEQVIFKLPRGARIDTTVAPFCPANEVQFQLQGASACPSGSRVGDGFLSADTGVDLALAPRVIETEVTFFNNDHELILFAESTNTLGLPIRVASRIEVRRRKFISTVPPLPGLPPPDPFLALDMVYNDLIRLKTGAGAYIRTPRRCRQGRWFLRAKFTYRDGIVETAKSATPCRVRGASGSSRQALD